MFLLVALLVYLSLYLVGGVFVVATLAAARVTGITVEKIELGAGPRFLKATWNAVDVEWRLLPITSAVKMLGMGEVAPDTEPPPRSFPAASAPRRILVSLAGPLGLILCGLSLLAIPIVLESPQLSATYASEESIEPRAVPLLYQHREAAHRGGQWQLWRDTGCEYALRLLTFRPLPGYGGYIGFVATTTAATLRAPGNGLTCLGVFALTLGLGNLLPLPSQGGGLACLALWEGITRRRIAENTLYYLLFIGTLFLLVIAARMVWLDISWLAGLITS